MRVGKGPQKPKAKPKDAPTPAPKMRVGAPKDRKVIHPPTAPADRDVDHRHEPQQWIVDEQNWRTSKYDYASLGLAWTGREAVCVYGCGGTTANVSGLCYHRWDCEYWQREGKERTPFD